MNFMHSLTKFEYLPIPLNSIISPPSLSDTKRIDHPRSTLTIVQVKGIFINNKLHCQFSNITSYSYEGISGSGYSRLSLDTKNTSWFFRSRNLCPKSNVQNPELNVQNPIYITPYPGFDLANFIVRIQIFRF